MVDENTQSPELTGDEVAILENTAASLESSDVNATNSVAEAVESVREKATVIIKPSIGRIVLFRPVAEVAEKLNMIDQDLAAAQPLAAQIVYVHDDHTINIAGFDQYGHPFTGVNVALLTGMESEPYAGPHCHWMDYQIRQALREHQDSVAGEA